MARVFRGIRYARAERFGHPLMETCPDVPVESAFFGPVCPQASRGIDSFMGVFPVAGQSEDCLFLSVYTPDEASDKAVMVFIPGGAYLCGGGESPKYDAQRLADEGDIIVVTINYRVGVFGFLYLPENDSVNLGLEDQICALKWVRLNISKFGGNPDKVTVCGHSSGAHSIRQIIGSVNTPLFTKAILQSSPLLINMTPPIASKIACHYLIALDKDVKDAGVDEMLAKQDEIVRGEKRKHPLPFVPMEIRTGKKSTVIPGLVSVMMTCQDDDALPFVRKPVLNTLFTRMLFKRPMLKYAATLLKNGVTVSTKVLDWSPDNGLGACHGLELPLLFGDWEQWQDAPMLKGVSEDELMNKGRQLRREWADFVKS